MQYFRIFLTALTLTLMLAACSGPKTVVENTPEPEKLKVYTSFYTLYDFTKKIGGDKIDLVNLVPAGMEPHDWDPSPRRITDLAKADIFIYNGAGLEPWAEKFLVAAANPELLAVNTSDGLSLLQGYSHDEEEEEHEDEHSKEGSQDPHVWLNPLFALEQGRKIKDALASKDPANQESYESNFNNFAKELEALDQAYSEALAPFKGKEIVVTHEAFGYLTNRYNLVQLPIMGISPDAEPSPAALAKLAKVIKEKNIKYIFFEELVNTKVADILAREVGAQTLSLNPIEGLTEDQEKSGKDYFALMYENLQNLKTALEIK